jgi:PPP family 3-phenylpropionic acid transporter
MTHAMRVMRAQYFLTYAVMGCVLPYLPVLLRARGMQQTQVGYLFAISGVAVLLAPVLVTLLADTRADARSLMAGALAVAGASLVGLALSRDLVPLLSWYALHALAMTPLMPLQDGLLFAVQERGRRELGAEPLPFHRVRVWGTIGFVVPSVALFWLLRAGARVDVTLICGAACAALAALWARLLVPGAGPRAPLDPDGNRLPTLEALRVLARPDALVFCAATFLLGVATASYYAFYPIYLTEVVGIDAQWVGLIANVGVVIEILFMLAFGKMLRIMGLKWLIVAGIAATAARFALLAAAPNVTSAIATQAFHGMMVLMVAVVPPLLLERWAAPRFRHSMQGLYAMLVWGVARTAGSLLAGPVAQRSVTVLFWVAAAICAASAVLVVIAFREHEAHVAADTAVDAEVIL